MMKYLTVHENLIDHEVLMHKKEFFWQTLIQLTSKFTVKRVHSYMPHHDHGMLVKNW